MPGGWKDSDRRERLPADWLAIVRAVHRRSGNRCEVPRKSIPGNPRCGRLADGGVDHIDPNGGDALTNLQDTCRWHHRQKTTVEGQQAKAEKKASRRRPAEKHPGLIAQAKR